MYWLKAGATLIFLIINNKNMEQELQCPQCGSVIPLTEALHKQITEQVKSKIAEENKKEKEEIAKRLKEVQGMENKLKQDKENMDIILEGKLKKAGLKQQY